MITYEILRRTLRLKLRFGVCETAMAVSAACEAAIAVSAIAAILVRFEPCSIIVVPHHVRVLEDFQAAYIESLYDAYPPPLVDSSDSEPVRRLPTSSSEPSSVDELVLG